MALKLFNKTKKWFVQVVYYSFGKACHCSETLPTVIDLLFVDDLIDCHILFTRNLWSHSFWTCPSN